MPCRKCHNVPHHHAVPEHPIRGKLRVVQRKIDNSADDNGPNQADDMNVRIDFWAAVECLVGRQRYSMICMAVHKMDGIFGVDIAVVFHGFEWDGCHAGTFS